LEKTASRQSKVRRFVCQANSSSRYCPFPHCPDWFQQIVCVAISFFGGPDMRSVFCFCFIVLPPPTGPFFFKVGRVGHPGLQADVTLLPRTRPVLLAFLSFVFWGEKFLFSFWDFFFPEPKFNFGFFGLGFRAPIIKDSPARLGLVKDAPAVLHPQVFFVGFCSIRLPILAFGSPLENG